ncbi:6-phosphofructokinase [Candidatus Bipolaricaulota bacterium]|nr:6-phosphofructokinase [Candidatus Bipolaricaulota bacterium]
MKRVAVLTSGGDAPGMNAAVRAVVKAGLARGWQMIGIMQGYVGLIANDVTPLGYRDVGGIIQQGGTILGSSRCPELRTEAGRQKAIQTLSQHSIDALVVIGGNGSQTGAYELSRMGVRVIGIGSTIDNDLVGSEMTIGVDTALNIALEAIDRLKVTASSHHRAFIVEVMGRECGYIALVAGITGGAEAVVLPGDGSLDPDALALHLHECYSLGKRHALVVVAEGAHWNGRKPASYFHEHHSDLGFEMRLTILGHVQRGGSPGAFDRLLASRLGAAAIERLAADEQGVLVGLAGGRVEATPLADVAGRTKPLDLSLVELAEILAK